MAVDELDELIDFLVDKRAAVKLQALDILLGLTGSPEGIDRLKTKLDKLLVFTMRLICDEQKEAAHKVLSVLVNLSQDPDVAAKMLKMNAIKRSMDYLKEGQCSQPRLLVGHGVPGLHGCTKLVCSAYTQLCMHPVPLAAASSFVAAQGAACLAPA